MFKHVETQFWGMVLLYSILVNWVWFIFALATCMGMCESRGTFDEHPQSE
jgi:hypothetical protein